MKGWFNEPMRHSLAARGIRTTFPHFAAHHAMGELDIDEFEQKLSVYLSYIDGRYEIENGREAVEGLHKYLMESGIEVDIEDMVKFFAEGNKILDVVDYEVVGSRRKWCCGTYCNYRPDSDLDILLHLRFTKTASELFGLDIDWDEFFGKLQEDMVNQNFYVRTLGGGRRLIDVQLAWEPPVPERALDTKPTNIGFPNYITHDQVQTAIYELNKRGYKIHKSMFGGDFKRDEYMSGSPIALSDDIYLMYRDDNNNVTREQLNLKKALRILGWIE